MEPSLINSPNHRFVIFNTPNDTNLPIYINNIVNGKFKATVWVRACEPLYSDEKLIRSGVEIYNLSFPDGTIPTKSIIDQWLSVLKEHKDETIAVHCIAGLGRAPLLVSIAMIEDGISPLETVQEIRRVRPGALNLPQVKFICNYKKTKSCLLL